MSKSCWPLAYIPCIGPVESSWPLRHSWLNQSMNKMSLFYSWTLVLMTKVCKLGEGQRVVDHQQPFNARGPPGSSWPLRHGWLNQLIRPSCPLIIYLYMFCSSYNVILASNVTGLKMYHWSTPSPLLSLVSSHCFVTCKTFIKTSWNSFISKMVQILKLEERLTKKETGLLGTLKNEGCQPPTRQVYNNAELHSKLLG